MEEDKTKKYLDTKEKIISLMNIRGPILPIHITKETGLSMLFASAFLSELFSDKRLKISSMKVGGSPLYFLPGQENMLERFHTYLPHKEKEAFLMLKERSILQDEKLEPAIRVAIRSLKDFAFPLIVNMPDRQIIFWKFLTFPEEEAKRKIEEILEPKEKKPEIKKKVEVKKEPEIKKEIIEEKPLITLKPKIKEEKIKEKSDFVKKILSFLEKENIEIIEEKEAKKKDFTARVRINSDLGKIELLAVCRDKLKITENDLAVALQKAQSIKLPALFISNSELNNKAKSYLESWQNLLKFIKIQ